MHTFYVYLNVSENRLIRTQTKNYSDDVTELISFNTGQYQTGDCLTKAYCLGYCIGINIGLRPINDISEFNF